MYKKVLVQGIPHWDVNGRLVAVIAGGDDAAAPPADAPVQEAPKATPTAAGDSPWAKDFATRGISDPAMDAYMREVQQPYVTKIEQQLRGFTDLIGDSPEAMEQLGNLLSDIQEDPYGVIEALVQMHGLDLGQLMDSGAQGDEPSDTQDSDSQGAQYPDEVRDWVLEQKQAQEKQAQVEAYNQFRDEVQADFEGSFDEELFRNAVIRANGNPREARALYERYHDQYVGKAEPKPKPDAPVALGTDGEAGRPAPREAKRYPLGNKGIREMIDDALAV